MTDYTQKNNLTDIVLKCRDGISLYYNKWPLSKNCLKIAPLIQDSSVKEINVDFNSGIVTKVLEYIDNDSNITFTSHKMILQLYELAYKCGYSKLITKMEKTLECNASLPILHSLKKRKSDKYKYALRNYMKSKNYMTDNSEVQMIPRYIVDDIITEYQSQIYKAKYLG